MESNRQGEKNVVPSICVAHSLITVRVRYEKGMRVRLDNVQDSSFGFEAITTQPTAIDQFYEEISLCLARKWTWRTTLNSPT